jgi:hypothetical protein
MHIQERSILIDDDVPPQATEQPLSCPVEPDAPLVKPRRAIVPVPHLDRGSYSIFVQGSDYVH